MSLAPSAHRRRPFVHGRFADLPELPGVPHGYWQSQPLVVRLEHGPFAGMRVHVRKHGAGPPLLLLHGLMTSSYSWRYVLEPLGERFTCWAPDLPGNGRSDRPLGPSYEPESLAGWLDEVQRALGVRGCPVIANSMGGYVAMHLALRDPGAMSRLVNVHSPGVPELRLQLLRAAFAVPGADALARWLFGRRPLEWVHRNVHYFDESLKSMEEAREYGTPLRDFSGQQALVKFLTETMALGPMRAFHRTLDARLAAGQPFPVPLLLLYARRDPMVPPRFGEVFARKLPGSKLVWLDDASHFAHVDAVERFLPPVLEFLGDSVR